MIRREQLLLRPEVRARRDRVLELLHPQFAEHGASGRTWDRLAIAEALTGEVAEPITLDDVEADLLADDVVLLTYKALTHTARTGMQASLRSSVWARTTSGKWLLRFHQGTPAPH